MGAPSSVTNRDGGGAATPVEVDPEPAGVLFVDRGEDPLDRGVGLVRDDEVVALHDHAAGLPADARTIGAEGVAAGLEVPDAVDPARAIEEEDVVAPPADEDIVAAAAVEKVVAAAA